MRKPLKPREEIIGDLAQVFRAHGFEGASLSLLVQGTGLERASLYHHFPNGKSDMAEAVLLQALSQLSSQVLETLKGEASAAKRFENMLSAVEEFYDEGNEVCFLTIFSVGTVTKKVSDEMSRAVKAWLKLLESVLREMKVVKAQESAQLTLSAIQGGLVLAHTLKDPKVFRNSLKALNLRFKLL